jgi:hypothetical protein
MRLHGRRLVPDRSAPYAGGRIDPLEPRRPAADVVIEIAPSILGARKDAVGDLRAARASEGLRVIEWSVQLLGDDVALAGDLP